MHKTVQRTTRGLRRRRRQAGYTVTELLVASSISILVSGGFLAAFITAVYAAGEGRQFGWAQSECVRSSRMVMNYMRNACAVDSIDISGDWIQLSMPNGNVSRFEYVTDPQGEGQGSLTFVADVVSGTSTSIVSRGLTKIMTLPVRNVFAATGDDTVRVSYRVTEPMSPGECPAEVEYGVRLRNAD